MMLLILMLLGFFNEFMAVPRGLLPPSFHAILTPKCQPKNKETFCQDVQNYPSAIFKSNLNISMSDFYSQFGGDFIQEHANQSRPEPQIIESADMVKKELSGPGGQTNLKRICKAERILYFPQAAINVNKLWKYIYNFEGYIQGVQIERCKTENESCEEIEDLLVFGQKSICKQLYMIKSLLSAESQIVRPSIDRFRVPSACVCYLKNNF